MPLKQWLTFPLLICLTGVSYSHAGDIRYDRGERRDPMIPLIGPGGMLVQKVPTGDLHIEGVIYDPSADSLVLINGEFYKEGEMFQNTTIVRIFKDRIILRAEEEEKTVWIQEEFSKEGEKKDGKDFEEGKTKRKRQLESHKPAS